MLILIANGEQCALQSVNNTILLYIIKFSNIMCVVKIAKIDQRHIYGYIRIRVYYEYEHIFELVGTGLLPKNQVNNV